MKKIKYSWRILLFCVMVFAPGCRFHMPAYYYGRILIKDGSPCFSIADNRENRMNHPEIQFIEISFYPGNEENSVWYREFFSNKSQIKFSPGECIACGEGVEPESSLQYGSRYRVFMMGDVDGLSRVYLSRFCLSEKTEGGRIS